MPSSCLCCLNRPKKHSFGIINLSTWYSSLSPLCKSLRRGRGRRACRHSRCTASTWGSHNQSWWHWCPSPGRQWIVTSTKQEVRINSCVPTESFRNLYCCQIFLPPEIFPNPSSKRGKRVVGVHENVNTAIEHRPFKDLKLSIGMKCELKYT